jgi:hypothetical protein
MNELFENFQKENSIKRLKNLHIQLLNWLRIALYSKILPKPKKIKLFE